MSLRSGIVGSAPNTETNDGWSSVAYFGGKTANDVSGWVRSARLKTTGTMGPSQ